MTDKEKLDAIRAEIHRLVDVRGYDRGMANDLFAFMDSLPNEPVSNDLEREIKHYVYDPYFDLNGVAVKGATDYLTVEDVADIARHFAQWQKKQEAKEVDIEKEYDDYTKHILACDVQFKPFTHLHNCAKHFYELGLKAKSK